MQPQIRPNGHGATPADLVRVAELVRVDEPRRCVRGLINGVLLSLCLWATLGWVVTLLH